jgi:DNA-binding XRE family transcriptional regulator
MSDDIPELTRGDFARMIHSSVRRRIMAGRIDGGDDVAALRRFVGLTQAKFARALGVRVAEVRDWERGRSTPGGPALALLRIAARHPRVLKGNLVATG